MAGTSPAIFLCSSFFLVRDDAGDVAVPTRAMLGGVSGLFLFVPFNGDGLADQGVFQHLVHPRDRHDLEGVLH